MRRAALILPLTIAPLTIALGSVSACSADPGSAEPTATPTGAVTAGAAAGPTQPRAQLAARAAAAKDLRQVAFYTLKSPHRADRQLSITRATDGAWRIDVPGGAHGGAVDIALVFTGGMLHQCALPASTHPYGGCVAIPGRLPAKADPQVEHLITDWLADLTDTHLAVAVSAVPALAGAAGGGDGACYSVESSAASLTMPMDAGIYCYRTDGTLTAARVSFGTLTLTGPPGAAPPTVPLPGALVPGQPLPLAAPPTPSPSRNPSASPSASPSAAKARQG